MEGVMKVYLVSLSVGALVGLLYALLNVRSPAPPIVALVGLLGILAGEQIPPLVKQLWNNEPLSLSWVHQIRPHVFGKLPEGRLTAGKQSVGIRPNGVDPS
jgi:XapX domain-containing protein